MEIEIGWGKELAIRTHLGILVKVVMVEHVQNQPREKNMLQRKQSEMQRIVHQLDCQYSSNFGRSRIYAINIRS